MNLWEMSNYGPGVTLTAPASNIVAADPTIPSGYSKGSGTSDATTFVSATAALVRSKFPNLTADQVMNRLIRSATFLNDKVTEVPRREVWRHHPPQQGPANGHPPWPGKAHCRMRLLPMRRRALTIMRPNSATTGRITPPAL